jgi:hypothetical protein
LRFADLSLIHNHPHQPNYETEVVSALCMTRSFETETVWIMCNAGGDDIEGFMGGSGIWIPLRGRVAGLGVAAGMEVVDVDLAVLKVCCWVWVELILGRPQDVQDSGGLEPKRGVVMYAFGP